MDFERFIIGEKLKPDMKIYRYMSFKQFMYFVEYNKTYFTRITAWDDTWEAPTTKMKTEFEDGKLEVPLYSSGMELFAQCWTSKEESDAMWRIYSNSKDGIKIQTTVKKLELLEGINYYAVEKVFYYKDLMEGLNYSQKLDFPMRVFWEGLIKRDAFTHEQEVRVITSSIPTFKCLEKNLDLKDKYLELGLNAKDFIEEIIIDPRAENYYVEAIKSYCKRLGFEIVPKKSSLYDDIYNDDIYNKNKIIQKFISVK